MADEAKAKLNSDTVPDSHPFELRYDRIEFVDFESCSRVLDHHAQLDELRVGLVDLAIVVKKRAT